MQTINQNNLDALLNLYLIPFIKNIKTLPSIPKTKENLPVSHKAILVRICVYLK